MLQKSSRLNKQIDDYFSELTARVARLDINSLFHLTLITGLAAFRKRIPADFEICIFSPIGKALKGHPWITKHSLGYK
jgi:hypothetical protein